MTEQSLLHRAETFMLSSLESLPQRVAHSYGVARRMEQLVVAPSVDPEWNQRMVAAAMVHDVGYGYPQTGMHALDGAVALAARESQLADLAPHVCWHSTARFEYAARGMEDIAFAQPDPVEQILLWVADFTTTHLGQPTTWAERLDGIVSRYPDPTDPVRIALAASGTYFDLQLATRVDGAMSKELTDRIQAAMANRL